MKIKDILLEEEHDLVELGKKYTRGDFTCPGKTISLKGAPREVSGSFDCSHTDITSLEGAPEHVHYNFYCDTTNITSLIGAPREVGSLFSCLHVKIISLDGSPESVGGMLLSDDIKLTSLKGLPKSCKKIWLPVNYEGPILRLCLVKGLNEVYGIKSDLALDIIRKYLNQGNAGLIKAQRELIENDLEIYAKL